MPMIQSIIIRISFWSVLRLFSFCGFVTDLQYDLVVTHFSSLLENTIIDIPGQSFYKGALTPTCCWHTCANTYLLGS